MSDELQGNTAPMMNVQVDVQPTVPGVMLPPMYANYVRVACDENGTTLYFFSVPAELALLPEVNAQLGPEKAAPPDGSTIRVSLPPVVKVVVPHTLVPLMIQSLMKNMVLSEQMKRPSKVEGEVSNAATPGSSNSSN